MNGEDIPITHFHAHLHDNAEGLLDFPKELRILLSDAEVPKDALTGIVFDLLAEKMAKDGKLRGLLLKLNPEDRGELRIVLLNKPEGPHACLMTHTLTSSGKDTIKNFSMSGNSVSGEIECVGEGESSFVDMPDVAYSMSFKADIVREGSEWKSDD